MHRISISLSDTVEKQLAIIPKGFRSEVMRNLLVAFLEYANKVGYQTALGHTLSNSLTIRGDKKKETNAT